MICASIQKLIDYSVNAGLIAREDALVVRNMLMDTLHVYDWTDEPVEDCGESIDELLKPLIDFACENGVIEDTTANHDLFDTKLMGVVTPLPHEVIRTFKEHYQASPEAATDWYFDFSQKLNYVRAGRIAKERKKAFHPDPYLKTSL